MMEFKKRKSKCSAAAAVRNRHLCEVLIISCNCYIFFFVLWYSSSMHAWYTIPILITLSCIFLACMLVYISGFMLDCLGSFTFVQNDCFALWYLGTTNSYMQGIGVVDSLIRWNHVKIYMFVFCLPLNQLTGSGHFYLLCIIEIIWRIVEKYGFYCRFVLCFIWQ